MYKQGDIVIVPYPFSDSLKKYKYRPAVVVSNDISNELDDDVLICPITSTLRKTEFSYIIKEQDVKEELPFISEVRCNKIVTVRSALIKSRFNELNIVALREIINLVKSSF